MDALDERGQMVGLNIVEVAEKHPLPPLDLRPDIFHKRVWFSAVKVFRTLGFQAAECTDAVVSIHL